MFDPDTYGAEYFRMMTGGQAYRDLEVWFEEARQGELDGRAEIQVYADANPDMKPAELASRYLDSIGIKGVRIADRPSTLTLTRFQVRASSSTRLVKSAGWLATARTPAPAKASRTLGCSTALAMPCCNWLMIAGGVPPGAMKPNQYTML